MAIVIVLAVIFSVTNILHVIVWLAQTPPGTTFLATGHYYLDYFIYLQAIAQGMRGRLLPVNYMDIGDLSIQLRFLPYSLLGGIGAVLRLSPMATYWLSVFFLTVLFLILAFVTLRRIFANQWLPAFMAWLLMITAAPVYRTNFAAYDFWYGPSNFVRRFGTVPYHLISYILILLVILNRKRLWINPVLITVLAFISPFNALLLYLAVALGAFKKNFRYFAIMTVFTVIPLLLVKSIYGGMDLYRRISNLEILWQERVSVLFFLLTIGPMVLFFPLGLISYFQKINPTGKAVFLFTFISLLLFFSPVAVWLGTHNLRFLTPINYIFFSALAVAGIKMRNLFLIGGFGVLLLHGILYNGYLLRQRIIGAYMPAPITSLTYISNDILSGLKYLETQPDKAVISGPLSNMGMIIPVFANKKVYLGREIETPDFSQRQKTIDNIFNGWLPETEVRNIINTYGIGYLVLTSLDNYQPQNINRYPFFKQIFNNRDLVIWKVNK